MAENADHPSNGQIEAEKRETARLLDVRLRLMDDMIGKRPPSSVVQWASLATGTVLLVAAAAGFVVSVEARITRLETTVGWMAQEISLLRTAVSKQEFKQTP